ncbi:5-formyltetrahydrofolate cyclo-ligase [Paenibacillus sp. TRM 82003]|uniref:5-formyltetrahydrofolate cyclo-ligase n=1 Tax=Kineococcus sp. TRM81007 TaxID=2925831 RepID=UPI001F59F33F|nr:5-formyltetrahydrofolate cyclo-ligase [Kineococcus sp. TRM81007]MCI2239863.1 5-formyltetrahydrofolate cyclo-ligase [Kineococcus sp. TRM81007]MCI3925833.1 5-formyltetrahydrofolate cyclo-ligase [Paenibacillus sp. TRM 82003]
MPPTRDDARSTTGTTSRTTPHAASRATSHPGRLHVAHDPVEVGARKLGLRTAVRARRRTRGAAEAAEVDAAVARTLLACPLVAGAHRVACYSSLPGEPGTRSALSELRRHGVEVLLPVLLPDADLDWEVRAVRSDATGGHGHGPLGPHAIATADVVVVPALAVDTAGRRLGQGGGSYDRALRRVPARVPVVALVHDDELFDAAVSPLPVLPHDRPVQAVVTPTRWMPFTA